MGRQPRASTRERPRALGWRGRAIDGKVRRGRMSTCSRATPRARSSSRGARSGGRCARRQRRQGLLLIGVGAVALAQGSNSASNAISKDMIVSMHRGSSVVSLIGSRGGGLADTLGAESGREHRSIWQVPPCVFRLFGASPASKTDRAPARRRPSWPSQSLQPRAPPSPCATAHARSC